MSCRAAGVEWGNKLHTLDLTPRSKIIRDYYQSLDQRSLLHATHEGAVRSAFGNVLDACARKFHWTLVNEYEVRRKKKLLRVDGALVDPWSLTHGFWEAKDEDDDLAVEAKKKIALGYPDDNIIFQAPDRAILYQGGKRVADENLGPEHRKRWSMSFASSSATSLRTTKSGKRPSRTSRSASPNWRRRSNN